MESTSRKNDILQSALLEFSQKSYDEASLNTILKNGGISKGSFYYHFTDKKDLYLTLLRSSAEAKWEFIRSHTEASGVNSGDMFQLFRAQARIGSEFGASHPLYHRLGRMLVKERGKPIYDDAILLLGGDSEIILTSVIDKAIADDELWNEYSREFLIKLFTYLFTHYDDIFNLDDDCPVDQTLEQLDQFVFFLQHGAERQNSYGKE